MSSTRPEPSVVFNKLLKMVQKHDKSSGYTDGRNVIEYHTLSSGAIRPTGQESLTFKKLLRMARGV